jgi:hypothetical protein
MVITVGPELEAAIAEHARRRGVAPDQLALDALRRQFPPAAAGGDHAEWVRQLRRAASDCGVSLPHEAVGSEGLYD